MTRLIAARWIPPLSTAKWLAFAVVCGLMYFRQPAFFSSPRFWAEEGAVYYQYALQAPWYQVLFTPPPGFDYYSLLNNFISVMAYKLVPLEHAPLVTTLTAYGIQCIPIAIILWGNSELYNYHAGKLVAILIVLFTLSSREVWLNTTNSHFYLLLITVLILFECLENTSSLRKWLFRLLLIVAGLTGPTSCFIAPLFLLKAVMEKTREYFIQTTILFIATSIQIFVFFLRLNITPLTESRFSELSVGTFGFIAWSRTIVFPLFGVEIADKFASQVLNLHSQNSAWFELVGVFLLVILIMCLILNLWSGKTIRYNKLLLVTGSYVLILFLFIVTSVTHGNKMILINAQWSTRYFYVPSVILLILILSSINFYKKELFFRIKNLFFSVFLMVALTSGIASHQTNLNWHVDWPDWRQEVHRHYSDSEYNQLQIWPPGWYITLEPR